jgi:plasmid stabilization system protein ParE
MAVIGDFCYCVVEASNKYVGILPMHTTIQSFVDAALQLSARAALRFRDEVNAAIERLTPFPQSHPSLSTTTQWIKLRRYPYLMVFQIRSASVIFIIAIAHARRRREYWKRRT